jgi:hypothetical protein
MAIDVEDDATRDARYRFVLGIATSVSMFRDKMIRNFLNESGRRVEGKIHAAHV